MVQFFMRGCFMASNRFRGIIEIELDKPRHIHFTLNSLIALEEKAGIPLGGLEKAPKTPRLLRDVLWAGLIHEDSALTPEAVGEMVGMAELTELWQAVTRALEASLSPSGEAPDPGNPAGEIVVKGAAGKSKFPGTGKRPSKSARASG